MRAVDLFCLFTHPMIDVRLMKAGSSLDTNRFLFIYSFIYLFIPVPTEGIKEAIKVDDRKTVEPSTHAAT